MLLTLLQFFATKFLVLALHLEAGSFPKPLSAREEVETFAALRAGDPTARERKLILLRYGLAGQPPLTQLETAQLLQISRSYVSRLKTHALDQLRKGWLQESPGE